MNHRKTIAAGALALSLLMAACAFTPARALFSKQEQAASVMTFAKTEQPGAVITFSAEDFSSRVSGEETLEGIVLSQLPDPECGVMRLAGRDLLPGEGVTVDSLDALSFAPATDADLFTTFTFVPVFSESGAADTPVQVSLNLSSQPNSAPIAIDLSVDTYVDLPVCGLLKSTDPDGDAVVYTLKSDPKKGQVTLAGDKFSYTPKAGMHGKDSFTYLACDDLGNPSQSATVTINVNKPEDKSTLRYSDMAQSTAHYAAIKLSEAGVLTGERIGSTSFLCPDKPVTRAEFVALAAAAAELPLPTSAVATGLADNEAIPTWAQPYVVSAISSGVVYGEKAADGNHVFRAEDTITRAEAAAILDRALELTDDNRTPTFSDAAAVPSWAQQSMINCNALSIVDTRSDNTIRPQEAVTREDAVQMLYEAMQYRNSKETSGGLFGLFRK